MSYVLVPATDLSGFAQLAHINNGSLERLSMLDFAWRNLSAVGEQFVAAVLPSNSERATTALLFRARIDSNHQVQRLPDVELRPHRLGGVLVVQGQYAYVGGSRTRRQTKRSRDISLGELAGRLDLSADHPVWEPLDLPIEAAPGKSIDDILIEGTDMILVDNIVFPKYLFIYNLPIKSELPSWRQTVQLPFSRVYEHIRKGQISISYVVLLSGSMGRDGAGTYVSVLRRQDYAPIVVFAFRQWGAEWWSETDTDESDIKMKTGKCPFDIALQDYMLVLACYDGLAYIDLRAFPADPQAGITGEVNISENEADGFHRFRYTYNEVDLRAPTPVPGLSWTKMQSQSRPDSIKFAGPQLLLCTTSGLPKLTSGRAWLHNQ